MNAEDMVRPRWWLCPADAHHGPRDAVVHYYHRWAYKTACDTSTWTGQENKMTAKKMGHLPTTKMVWTGLSTYSHNYTERKSNKGRPECAAEAAFMDGSIIVYYPEGAVRDTIGTL